MSTLLRNRLQGLPPYFGGKRKLLPWIFRHLAEVLPRSEWSSLIYMDAFMGGGSVSLMAKAYGFKQILANDWSERSQVIGQALLTNHRQQLSKEAILKATLVLEEPGFIQQTYCPSVFSSRHAKVLDQILKQSNHSQDLTQKSLLKLLLWHCAVNSVCFPTSLGTSNRPYAEAMDGLRSWDSLNPKRYLDGSIGNLLQPGLAKMLPTAKKINGSVFGGSEVSLFQEDAASFIAQYQGDVLYLDPPYPGTLAYEKANQVLDAILFGQQPISQEVSPFSSSPEALHPLLEAARHIPVWVISYGNKVLELPELVALVKRHRSEVVGFAKAYQHLSHVSKNSNNQELLVIAKGNA